MDNDRPFAPDEDDVPAEIFPGLRKTADPVVETAPIVDDDDSIPSDIFDAPEQPDLPSPWTKPAGPPPAVALPSADELWPEVVTKPTVESTPEPSSESATTPVTPPERPPAPEPVFEPAPIEYLEYPAPTSTSRPIESLWRYEPPPVASERMPDPEPAPDLEATVALEPAEDPEPSVRPAADLVTFDPIVLPDPPRRASPRTFIRPKPFPVAPPIRALAFDVVPPEPARVEPPAADPRIAAPSARVRLAPAQPGRGMAAPAPTAALPELSQPVTIESLLRVAVSRRASVLYLSSDAVPSLRIDGEVTAINGAPMLRAEDVEALLFSFTLAHHEHLRRGDDVTDLTVTIPDIGRVRCSCFRDGRGAGAVVRIAPPAATIDPIALSSEIRSLASEPNGLLLVAGPRSSGKQLLIASLVEFISRTRPASVVVLHRGVSPAASGDRALVSVRTVAPGMEDLLSAARAALRENPDVLALPELGSAPLIEVALDGAASGQLVIAGMTAPSACHALERMMNLCPRDGLRQLQNALAEHLRGIVGQILVPAVSGGLVAARELLLNTPAMTGILAEGKSWQLPLAIEAGRRNGMQPMADALAALVENGDVTPDDAYRRAPDALRFVEALKRRGLDPSFT